MIRVGRREDDNNPNYEGFTNIVVMMKSHSKWSSLSPYYSTVNGYIMENIWQFCKLYPDLPASTQKYSRYDSTYVWTWGQEKHLVDDNITQEYWNWRTAGFNNKYAVRYPAGIHNRNKCAFSVYINPDQTISRLNYIEARKKIYLPTYVESIKHLPQFLELKERLNRGENLLIIEVDGPHQESLNYYVNKYGVNNNFIQNKTMVANIDNLKIMLNDDKYPFGHGYCLAAALLNIDQSIVQDIYPPLNIVRYPYVGEKIVIHYNGAEYEYYVTGINSNDSFDANNRDGYHIKVILENGKWKIPNVGYHEITFC